nr:immunoglobulin heavy chain junction region [Macaca mulatta]
CAKSPDLITINGLHSW